MNLVQSSNPDIGLLRMPKYGTFVKLFPQTSSLIVHADRELLRIKDLQSGTSFAPTLSKQVPNEKEYSHSRR